MFILIYLKPNLLLQFNEVNYVIKHTFHIKIINMSNNILYI